MLFVVSCVLRLMYRVLCSLFVVRGSLFLVCGESRSVKRALFVTCCLLYGVRCLLLVVGRCVLFVVC